MERKSADEVEEFFRTLKNHVQERGRAVAQDGARITENMPGFDSLQKLEDALKEGDLTGHAANEVLKVFRRASLPTSRMNMADGPPHGMGISAGVGASEWLLGTV